MLKKKNGRPKLFKGKNATIIVTISQEYKKHLEIFVNRLADQTDSKPSFSRLFRLAAEAMFPYQQLDKTEPEFDPNQLDLFHDIPKLKKPTRK
jgi:hypothetical protein